MRKNYVAPSAKLMYFAPCEGVATDSWKWDPRTNGMQNPWNHENAEGIASVNSWFYFDGSELDA